MAERIPAKTNTQKLREVTDSLPEFTQQYFYSGTSSKAILTRLSYRSINATNIYARASDREEAVKNSRNWRNKKSKE